MAKICNENDIDIIIQDLLDGKVVGFPTETVYGLAIIYDNIEAYNKIYEIKNRNITKPISMMVSDINVMSQVAIIHENESKIINKLMPGSITIILDAKNNLPYHVTFNNKTIGIRIPDNKIALDILKKVGKPLLVTSANISGNAPLVKYQDVYDVFHDKISSLINIDAGNTLPSTVIRLDGDNINILREGPIKKETFINILKEK